MPDLNRGAAPGSRPEASLSGALGLKMGEKIVFASGVFKPYADEVLAWLAHQITHVLQHRIVFSRTNVDESTLSPKAPKPTFMVWVPLDEVFDF